MNEYAFDVTLSAAIRVKAETLDGAKELLRNALDCADSNFGAWPNGDPIVAEASLATSGEMEEPTLYEFNGEATDNGEEDLCVTCGDLNNDGEGFDGECGHCADLSYRATLCDDCEEELKVGETIHCSACFEKRMQKQEEEAHANPN